MKVKERNVLGFIALTIIIVLTIGSISHIKAVARESYFSSETDFSETEFRKEIKGVLAEYGAKNAGITMTKTCEDGHTLDYSVVINLPGYISLDNGKEGKLMEALSKVTLNVKGAKVVYLLS